MEKKQLPWGTCLNEGSTLRFFIALVNISVLDDPKAWYRGVERVCVDDDHVDVIAECYRKRRPSDTTALLVH